MSTDGLEGLTSTAAVYQSERTILTDWRQIADDLAEAFRETVTCALLGRAIPSATYLALVRYEAAVAHLKPEPLPSGPATHRITYWTYAGDRKTEDATSEPRGFTRPGKTRVKQGNRYGYVDAPTQWFEWRRPDGGRNEARADRLLAVAPIDAPPRITDAERVPDEEIFDGLTGEHISTPEGRPWDRTSSYLARRARDEHVAKPQTIAEQVKGDPEASRARAIGITWSEADGSLEPSTPKETV